MVTQPLESLLCENRIENICAEVTQTPLEDVDGVLKLHGNSPSTHIIPPQHSSCADIETVSFSLSRQEV